MENILYYIYLIEKLEKMIAKIVLKHLYNYII